MYWRYHYVGLISLRICTSKQTEWQTYKYCRIIWKYCTHILGMSLKDFFEICHPESEIWSYEIEVKEWMEEHQTQPLLELALEGVNWKQRYRKNYQILALIWSSSNMVLIITYSMDMSLGPKLTSKKRFESCMWCRNKDINSFVRGHPGMTKCRASPSLVGQLKTSDLKTENSSVHIVKANNSYSSIVQNIFQEQQATQKPWPKSKMFS